jgi:predicted esterase
LSERLEKNALVHHVFRALVLAASLFCASFPPAACADPLDASQFVYDASAPLDVHVVSSGVRDGVQSRIVTFASTGGRIGRAEILAPQQASGMSGGVLFVHWLGDPATTNHTEFEPDAYALAKRGATCVLIDAMWSTVWWPKDRDWFTQIRSTDTDYANSIDQVLDLRRALDLLQAQPGVDRNRIAYVGHDFGAMYGAVLAGVDPRPRWYVLMAGTTSFSEWYLLGRQPADKAAYIAQMAPLDPLPYLSRSHAQGFFFQFATIDRYITPEKETAFFSATMPPCGYQRGVASYDNGPTPCGMILYPDADHSLSVPDAMKDRLEWLGQRLFARSL